MYVLPGGNSIEEEEEDSERLESACCVHIV